MGTDAEFRLYDRLAALPHFNPDHDGDGADVHEAVRDWRKALKESDAVVICTPEYARGVPGSLKNALDWIVSSGELSDKPVAAISASPHPEGGGAALASLIATLRMMNASVPDSRALAIPFFSSGKLGPDGRVADPDIAASLQAAAESLWDAARSAE
jgi:NAD(P)H-dependent FMN reductase